MLRQLGYDVTACDEPERALEVFRACAGAFDALVTDLNMPKMTGIDLAIELRRIRPALGLVLITGCLGDGRTEEMASQLGIREIVMKPFTRTTLSGAVRRTIDAAEPMQPAPRAAA
jgi:CheY-like chemotaxis protein